ncbi:hypothetical protein BXY66_2120 [Shimia isoporae]|uniref:SIMPL domain-containing protein n=1 Tax=Shimia isoporae TaxID=647720 RepID=A0A4R1NXY0_9RHOB|nr:SIMPL domain-containing protein [Shimia isoporae]TCL10052.1 hypothetical protein BXY66_2120 [Shimia isoporae]
MRLAAICMMIWTSVSAGVVAAQERTITVVGEGIAAEMPDQAVITVGVSHRSASAQMAMENVGDVVGNMIEALTKDGIEARDIQTSNLGLHPVYNRNRDGDERPLLLGFNASNSLTIKLRDIKGVGEVLGTLVENGANDIGGISFGLRDPQLAMSLARKEAIGDARAKAELYAEAAGVKLGQVVTISEVRQGSPRPEMMRAAMADAVPIAPGEVSLTARVTMVFEIEG